MRSIFALFLFLALTSCGKNRQPEPVAPTAVREILVASLQEARELSKRARLPCREEEHCPENVGMILSSTAKSIFSCSGFLVDEETFATGSHCLPSEIKYLPDLCPQRIEVILPAAEGKQEEHFACKEILGFTMQPNAFSPDLALVRLRNKTGRTSVQKNHGGVHPNQPHSILKVEPLGIASGILVRENCQSIGNSYAFPPYKNHLDKSFVLGDCIANSGNSGAPVFNGDNEVVGVLQAELELRAEKKKFLAAHLEEGEKFSPLSMGTSLECLMESAGIWRLNPNCPSLDLETIVSPRLGDFPMEEKWKALLSFPEVFGWESKVLRAKALEQEEILLPRCFRPLESWIQKYSLQEPGHYLERAEISLGAPVLESRMVFNRYLQPRVNTRLKELKKLHLIFSPLLLGSSGTSPMEGLEDRKEMGLCNN